MLHFPTSYPKKTKCFKEIQLTLKMEWTKAEFFLPIGFKDIYSPIMTIQNVSVWVSLLFQSRMKKFCCLVSKIKLSMTKRLNEKKGTVHSGKWTGSQLVIYLWMSGKYYHEDKKRQFGFPVSFMPHKPFSNLIFFPLCWLIFFNQGRVCNRLFHSF